MIGDSKYASNSGPLHLVRTAAGVPLVAEQRELRTRLDGVNNISDHVASKVYRDGSGRVRVEFNARNEESSRIAYIVSPDGSSCILAVTSKIAIRIYELPGSTLGFPGIGLAFPSGELTVKTEELPAKQVQNLVLSGRRTTRHQTDYGQVAVEDCWFSDELKVTYEIKASGPTWTHVAQLEIIDRTEPDPLLFRLPPEYEVREFEHRAFPNG